MTRVEMGHKKSQANTPQIPRGTNESRSVWPSKVGSAGLRGAGGDGGVKGTKEQICALPAAVSKPRCLLR